MTYLSKIENLIIVQCVLFLVPVNIFVIGDWLAAGIQWIFFRYQQSYLGNSLIFFTRDLYYIQEGILKGKSVVASEITYVAISLMVLAVFLLIIATYQEKPETLVKASAVMTMGSGCLYLIADMVQYGIFFNGPAGFVIPIGVPVILGCGWWMYQMSYFETDLEELECAIPSDEKKSEN